MFLKIYLVGVLFLVGAIILNVAGKLLKLPSWYDFLANPKLSLISFVWLFVIYPFSLGIIFILIKKISVDNKKA